MHSRHISNSSVDRFSETEYTNLFLFSRHSNTTQHGPPQTNTKIMDKQMTRGRESVKIRENKIPQTRHNLQSIRITTAREHKPPPTNTRNIDNQPTRQKQQMRKNELPQKYKCQQTPIFKAKEHNPTQTSTK